MFKKKEKKTKKSFKSFLLDLLFTEDDIEQYVRKKTVPSKKKYTNFEVCFGGFVLFSFGLILGCLASIYTDSVFGYKIDSNTTEFLKTFKDIKENYYEEVDSKKLTDAAIAGMLGSLNDEYSYYMDENSTDSFNSTVNGKYTGVGITIQFSDDKTTIIDIFKNSPADKAGLQKGDILIKVDDRDVTKKDSSEISKLIKGEVGKKIKLTVKRNEEELDFTVTLAEIELQSVYSELKENNDKKIGYLKVDNFASNTYDQFKKELTSLEKKTIDSLIIDLRGNTGGHLSQATKMLDLFFKKGTVLYQIDTRGKVKKYKAQDNDSRQYPVVILVNHGSASASEILTACFKENYKNATIVGVTTYGKGTAQEAYNLSNGTSYKFTTRKWLTPKGEWINKKGIKPDVEVELKEDSDEDLQLQEAIKILSE